MDTWNARMKTGSSSQRSETAPGAQMYNRFRSFLVVFTLTIYVVAAKSSILKTATVENEGPSAKKPTRPVMAFCSVGAGLGPLLNSLVHQNQAFLSKPYPLDSQLMEIPLLTVSNGYVHGLQKVYFRKGSKLSCNDSFMECRLNLGVKDARLVFDWKVSQGMILRGHADIEVGRFEVDVVSLLPAEKGAGIVLESLRIVELQDLRADITGPWSGLVNANMIIELIRGWSKTNRQTLYRVLEVFIQAMVQKVLDRMDLRI